MSGGALRIAAAKAAGCRSMGPDADKKRKERAQRSASFASRQAEGSQDAAAAAAALPEASSAKVTPEPKHPKLTGMEDEEVPSSMPRNLEMEFAAVAEGHGLRSWCICSFPQ